MSRQPDFASAAVPRHGHGPPRFLNHAYKLASEPKELFIVPAPDTLTFTIA